MPYTIIDIKALLGIETFDDCVKLKASFPNPPLVIPKIGGSSTKHITVPGAGPFEVGVDIRWKCPGYPACGRQEGACKWSKKKGYDLNPLQFLPIKIPVLPSIPVLFPGIKLAIGFRLSFDPQFCPNSPNKHSISGGIGLK